MTAIASSVAIVMRRMPKRSCRAAANGAKSPYESRLPEIASEIVPWLQPNSSWSGTISTPTIERKPAVVTSTSIVTATITQRS